jgi:hypothetical protein
MSLFIHRKNDTMKKITCLMLLASLAASCIAQQMRSDTARVTPKDYRSKSTDFLVWGCLTLASGTVAAIVGADAHHILPVTEFLGIAVAAASIPLFASAIYCHGKISRVRTGVGMINTRFFPGCKAALQSYPAFTVSVRL